MGERDGKEKSAFSIFHLYIFLGRVGFWRDKACGAGRAWRVGKIKTKEGRHEKDGFSPSSPPYHWLSWRQAG